MRLFAQDLTTDTLQHIAARGLSEAGGPKPLLLRVLVDLFVTRPSHHDDEIQHFAEIAHSILPSATRPEVDHAAMRLCTHPAAPGELVDLLAASGGEGAVLLFEKCRRLSTPVLHKGAASGQLPAALAIAGRPDLDTATIDLLVARPEREIALALAANELAPLATDVLAILAERARDNLDLARHLTHRLPHRGECLGLFHLAMRTDRLLMLASARARLGEENGSSQALEHGAETALRKLEAAAQDHAQAFVAELSATLSYPPDMAAKWAEDKSGELLVVALRALGADLDPLLRIVQQVKGDLSQGQMAWLRAFALGLSRKLASDLVHAMLGIARVNPRHQPLHDQAARENGLRQNPLTPQAQPELHHSRPA